MFAGEDGEGSTPDCDKVFAAQVLKASKRSKELMQKVLEGGLQRATPSTDHFFKVLLQRWQLDLLHCLHHGGEIASYKGDFFQLAVQFLLIFCTQGCFYYSCCPELGSSP